MDVELETLFEDARATPPVVPDALMARIMNDAGGFQKGQTLWQRFLAAIGGAPGVGGLVAATCVGVWLGVSPPTAVPDLAGAVLGFETTSLDDFDTGAMTGFGWDIEEG